MNTPSEPPTLSVQERLSIEGEAAQALMKELLSSRQWAVATLYISGSNRPRIAAVNVYDDLPTAIASHGTLAAEIDPHEHVTLVPVGPITPGELRAAGLITDPDDS